MFSKVVQWYITTLHLLQVPVLDTDDGAIFESNAIARYVARQADTGLLGTNLIEMVRD